MLKKKWAQLNDYDENIIKSLTKEKGIDRNIAKLLITRNICDSDSLNNFFYPDIKKLHSPDKLTDIKKAIDRIDKALRNNEKILIYGDYDVDGITSVVLVYSILSKFTKNIYYYIPDRHDEGYGITIKSIDMASQQGVTLVIALDCGINAIEEIDYAEKKGIDYIICDHHNPSDQLPKAVAIVNPKREDCKYPFKDLSACGVAYKLIQALSNKRYIKEEDIRDKIYLVAISIACDVVPLIDENRIFVHQGLIDINTSPKESIITILRTVGITLNENREIINDTVFSRKIKIKDLSCIIGPPINAAGRIDNANKVVELLLESDVENLCREIDKNNNKRKYIERSIYDEAKSLLPYFENKSVNILYSDTWHKGVLGIVASRLIEISYKPTILMTYIEEDDIYSGSARSIEGFDIYKALTMCSNLLVKYGGHKYAAGLSIKRENINEFINKFEQIVKENITEDILTPKIKIDSDIRLNELSDYFFDMLQKFEPYGYGNPQPILESTDVTIVSQNNKYIKIKQDDSKIYNANIHGIEHLINAQNINNKCDICYTLNYNPYINKINIVIKDINFKA